ncbi:MAG: hypothetical protein II350_08825 [Clostridia bacterium]|nr:hypothetical protein [Clostridia bacterium]
MKLIKKIKRSIALALIIGIIFSLLLPSFATGTLIFSDPAGGSCSVGESAPLLTVSASAASGGVLSYQWYDLYGAAIPGATGSSFAPPTNTAGDFGYYVTVTESVEGTVVASDTSGIANIKVTRDAEKPKITANPSSASCTVGQTVTLYAKAEVATGTLSYRWYCYTSESAVGGATEIYTASSPSYSPPTDRASSVYYYCRITNTDTTANGETKVSVNSSTALVTVRNSGDAEAPVIYSQPADLVCTIGDEAQISVGATVSDGGEISYQWYSCDDETGANPVLIEGSNTAYFRPETEEETSLYVYCVLTNTNDSVTGQQKVEVVSDTVLFEVRKPDIVGAVWDGSSSGRFAGGSGTESDPFVIETAGQLGYFAALAKEDTLAGQHFILGEDIILSDDSVSNIWTPVGTAEIPFEGVFDGGGHSVSGLVSEDSACAGLFGYVNNSEIRNLSVSGSVSGVSAGGIAGAAENSVIENSVFSGTVFGSSCFGGIAGTVYGGAVSNCVSVGIPVAGNIFGYALTSSSFDSAEGITSLSRRAKMKAGLALWSVGTDGNPVLTTDISLGEGEDIIIGDLSPQAGISGSNAIAQMSVYGIAGESMNSLWVDPAEFSSLVSQAQSFANENSGLSVYVYLDGGNIVTESADVGAELILGEDETALLANIGSVWTKTVDNGVPVWEKTSEGSGAALTVDLGDVNVTWGSGSISEAVGSGRIAASFTSEGKSELSAVEIMGYSNGTWRIKSEAFSGRTELVSVIVTVGGHTKYSVNVNSGGFAEFTSRGNGATYLFFDVNGVPEEFNDVEPEPPVTVVPPAQSDPNTDPEGTGKPMPKKWSTAVVAVCAVAVSVGGALIYGFSADSIGKKKK